MASEQDGEQEQDYEAGDHSGHMGGWSFDDDGGTDDEEPFTEFEQFKRYDTTDELLRDLTKAGEADRKVMEDKIRQGGRAPRGGIPEADQYVMQKVDLFLQECESRVAQFPNQQSQSVKELNTTIGLNQDLVTRWMHNQKLLEKISTRGNSEYLHNDQARNKEKARLHKELQTDWRFLNKFLSNVLEGMHRRKPGPAGGPPAIEDDGSVVWNKFSKNWRDMQGFMRSRFTFIHDEVGWLDLKYVPKEVMKAYDAVDTFYGGPNPPGPPVSGGEVNTLYNWFVQIMQGDREVVEHAIGTHSQFDHMYDLMQQYERAWKKVTKKIKFDWAKVVLRERKGGERLPPTPSISRKAQQIAGGLKPMIAVVDRKVTNRNIMVDIQQGWEENRRQGNC